MWTGVLLVRCGGSGFLGWPLLGSKNLTEGPAALTSKHHGHPAFSPTPPLGGTWACLWLGMVSSRRGPVFCWASRPKGAATVCPLDVQKLTVPPTTLSPQVRDSYPAAVE